MLLAVVTSLILVALLFDYINGFHDAANSIATVVSTRVLTPFSLAQTSTTSSPGPALRSPPATSTRASSRSRTPSRRTRRIG